MRTYCAERGIDMQRLVQEAVRERLDAQRQHRRTRGR
jgi:hypothetical protein